MNRKSRASVLKAESGGHTRNNDAPLTIRRYRLGSAGSSHDRPGFLLIADKYKITDLQNNRIISVSVGESQVSVLFHLG